MQRTLKNADISPVAKITDERIETAKIEETNEITKALVEAQKKIQAAHKDGKNPHYKSKYATLEGVWEACREALNAHGLAVTQTIRARESGVFLRTRLLHTSGQSIYGDCPLLNPKGDMQGLGSAITYARRYSLAAIVGVVQEDDDGEQASLASSKTAGGASSESRSSSGTISEAQGKRLYAIATGELGRTKDWYLKFVNDWGLDKPSDMLKSEYEQFEQDMRNSAHGDL